MADAIIQRFKLKEVYNLEMMTDTRKVLEGVTKINAGKKGIITVEVGDKVLKRADVPVIGKRESGIFWIALDRARLMPGGAIVVPEDSDRTTFARNFKDWIQILYQFGLSSAAAQVLRQ